jgi:hypothetical protein
MTKLTHDAIQHLRRVFQVLGERRLARIHGGNASNIELDEAFDSGVGSSEGVFLSDFSGVELLETIVDCYQIHVAYVCKAESADHHHAPPITRRWWIFLLQVHKYIHVGSMASPSPIAHLLFFLDHCSFVRQLKEITIWLI